MAGPAGSGPVVERVREELQAIRARVTGVYGSLTATTDGLLVAHDLPGLEPAEIAALAATTQSLASRATAAAGCGQFRESVARGSDGCLAVYSAGDGAIVAVVGTAGLNAGMLHSQVQDVIERIAVLSAEFTRWAGGAARAAGHPARPSVVIPPQSPRTLPKRRGNGH